MIHAGVCVRDPNKLGTAGMWWVGSEMQETRKPVRTVAGLESTSGSLSGLWPASSTSGSLSGPWQASVDLKGSGQQVDPVCCGQQGSRAGASTIT